MSGPVRIFIIDDHPIVREGLRAILEGEAGFAVVGQAASGKAAMDLFVNLRPDVTLLDVHFPGECGLDILEGLRKRSPTARVLMISTFDHDEDIVKALRLGARGYVLKDVGAGDLVATVRAIHEGRTFIPPWVGDRLAERAGDDSLSDREREVLQLLVEGRSNKEIASSLKISDGTIKAHLSHIFDKLGVSDRTQAVLAALRRGLAHLD